MFVSNIYSILIVSKIFEVRFATWLQIFEFSTLFNSYNFIVLYGYVNQLHFPFSKGISQSALPYRRSCPTWLKITAEEVKEHIYKHGKKGLTPSQIGQFNL